MRIVSPSRVLPRCSSTAACSFIAIALPFSGAAASERTPEPISPSWFYASADTTVRAPAHYGWGAYGFPIRAYVDEANRAIVTFDAEGRVAHRSAFPDGAVSLFDETRRLIRGEDRWLYFAATHYSHGAAPAWRCDAMLELSTPIDPLAWAQTQPDHPGFVEPNWGLGSAPRACFGDETVSLPWTAVHSGRLSDNRVYCLGSEEPTRDGPGYRQLSAPLHYLGYERGRGVILDIDLVANGYPARAIWQEGGAVAVLVRDLATPTHEVLLLARPNGTLLRKDLFGNETVLADWALGSLLFIRRVRAAPNARGTGEAESCEVVTLAEQDLRELDHFTWVPPPDRGGHQVVGAWIAGNRRLLIASQPSGHVRLDDPRTRSLDEFDRDGRWAGSLSLPEALRRSVGLEWCPRQVVPCTDLDALFLVAWSGGAAAFPIPAVPGAAIYRLPRH